MSIHDQLDDLYKGDRYLKDRLSEAIDIPAIKRFFNDCPPRFTQPLIKRVATQLSDRKKTAGTAYANWELDPDEETQQSYYMYPLGQR